MNRRGHLILLALLGLAALLWLAPNAAVAARGGAEPVTLFTVPVGKEGVTYDYVDLEEAEDDGPAALAVAPDGTFWIADTPTSRLLHYSTKGEHLATIDLGEQAVGIVDLEVSPTALFALDIAAGTPALFHLTPKGEVLARHELPAGWHLADGLTGIAQGGQGEILLERHHGLSLATFLDGAGRPSFSPQASYSFGGTAYAVRPPDLNDPATDATRGTLILGDRVVAVETPNMVGGLTVLGSTSNGGVYVRVEEVAVDKEGAIQVDQTVRLYAADGSVHGVTRVPLAAQEIHVEHGVAVGPHGEIFSLATHADHIAIQHLKLVDHLAPLLPAMGIQGTNPFAPPAEALPTNDTPTAVDLSERDGEGMACVSGYAMHLAAYVSAVHLQSYNHTNVYGACTGRTRPHWLTVGSHRGIPYDWGGWDNADQLTWYMAGGYQAGDITSAGGINSCSRGMDCSGFVSVAWQLRSRTSTSTLNSITQAVSYNGYIPRVILGDVFNKPGDHVVMFLNFPGSGITAAESTTSSGYDRVITRARSWSSLSGYYPRRYVNHCGYY